MTMTSIKLTAAFLLSMSSGLFAAENRLVTWPAPAGEKVSTDYQVTVAGRPVDIHQARVNDAPWSDAARGFDAGGPYSFAQFDFSGKVEVAIHSVGRSLEKAVILGQGRKLAPQMVDANTLVIGLDRPEIVSIEPEGKLRPLYLFANPLEDNPPKDGDPHVVFFGPGVHRPEGGVVELKNGQTLYLAGGAVVEAAVHCQDGENLCIRGRGILCGNSWAWRKGPGHMLRLENCKNVSIEGIILRGAWAWTIVPVGCEDVRIENVKLCNGRVLNDDGINPCNSRRITIRRCFIRTMDDCVALKGLDAALGDVDGITVEDSVLWCDFARITLLGHESRAARMQNVVYRNLDIVHHGLWPVFLLEVSDEMALNHVRFQDLRIRGHGQPNLATVRPYITQYSQNKVWGRIEDVTFKNITVEGPPGKYAVLLDCAPEHGKHRIKNLAFENVRVLGEVLDEHSLRVVFGCWIARPASDGITFSP